MLFSEIYGNYYHAVSRILKKALDGTLDNKALNQIVQEEAFKESIMTIPDSLLGGDWGLLSSDFETIITREPSRSLTILEKRWMKAILLDPRIQLFHPDMAGLEGIEPLFKPDWLVYFDQYTDGDPYTNPLYIEHFSRILMAIRDQKQLEITYIGGKGDYHHTQVSPKYLEYSEKDDKFRLVGDSNQPLILNLSRIKECLILGKKSYATSRYNEAPSILTLYLTDERNALERFLLHFSHLKKETKRLDEKHYLITMYYDKQDETEMLIRILSFGQWVKVLAPENLVQKIRLRIELQIKLTEKWNK